MLNRIVGKTILIVLMGLVAAASPGAAAYDFTAHAASSDDWTGGGDGQS